jgi:hypothetical protein
MAEEVKEKESKVRNVVSLDDEGVVQGQMPYFKAAKDQVTRVCIPDISKILVYSQHFVQDGGFVRCLKDKGEDCPMCKLVDDPVTRFKVNMIVYNTTTQDGSVPEDLNYVSIEHKVFRFGIKMFAVLRQKHKKLAKTGGLGSVDLTLTCTNDQYQHFDVDDQKECLILEDERLKAMAAKLMKDKFIDFDNARDRDLKFPTPVQIKKWLEVATGQKQDGVDATLKNEQEVETAADALVNDLAKGGAAAPAGNIKDLV